MPCPPEAEPVMPQITATASAAPINGSPGRWVIQWSTSLNAGKVSTALPKPTTEQVDAAATMPFVNPCPRGVQTDLRQRHRQTIAANNPQKMAKVGSFGNCGITRGAIFNAINVATS